jgi:hypothetical protein
MREGKEVTRTEERVEGKRTQEKIKGEMEEENEKRCKERVKKG